MEADELHVVGLKVGGGDPLAQVGEGAVRRDDSLAADGEERWLGHAVPLGKPGEVRDGRLRLGEGERVAHLFDLLPHPLLLSGLAVLFSARAGDDVM